MGGTAGRVTNQARAGQGYSQPTAPLDRCSGNQGSGLSVAGQGQVFAAMRSDSEESGCEGRTAGKGRGAGLTKVDKGEQLWFTVQVPLRHLGFAIVAGYYWTSTAAICGSCIAGLPSASRGGLQLLHQRGAAALLGRQSALDCRADRDGREASQPE